MRKIKSPERNKSENCAQTHKLKKVKIETDSHIDIQKWNKQFELWCSYLFINQNF